MIIAAYFLVAWILAVLQYSFLAFWPGLQYLMPLLVLSLFATVAHRPAVSLAVVVWCGIMIDWYSSAVTGVNVLIFLIIWLVVTITMRRFFTNLSLLSGVAMMILSVVMYRLLCWIIIVILNALNYLPVRVMISRHWLDAGLWMILINGVIFGILFFGANRISRIFNFAFINKR